MKNALKKVSIVAVAALTLIGASNAFLSTTAYAEENPAAEITVCSLTDIPDEFDSASSEVVYVYDMPAIG